MKYIISIIILSLSSNIFSQNYTINGYVSDIENGEKLINATILEKNTSNAVLTNDFGYYSITIKKPQRDTILLLANSIGYEPIEFIININTTKTVDFKLKSKNQIDSVIITAQIPITETTDIGTIKIPINQIKLMPAIGAESDVFKSLQLLPGIQGGNEGTSNLYVRGGSPDENLILLDDVPLYYVNHLGGFISVFNTDALKSVKIIKGGFPAHYGSRLSSVLDIRMKDGDIKKYHGNFSIGLSNAKFLYEGPIIKNKASIIISARALPWEIFTYPLTFFANEGQILGYNFHDINAKINYKINPNNHIYFSFYTGDDKINFKLSKIYYSDKKMNYKLIWGNRLLATRWNHVFSQKLFVNTTLAYTRFRYNNTLDSENKTENQSFFYNFNTGINDVVLKSTFEYNATNFYKIKFGFNAIFHKFRPGVAYLKISENDTIQTETTLGTQNIIGFENRLFIENNIKIGIFLKTNIGVHLSDYFIEQKHYPSIQPRIVTNLIVTENLSFKIGYSEMMQYVHLLTSNSIGLTPDLWVPTNSEMPPSKATQISIGVFKNFRKKTLEFSSIAYYKSSNNLITYKEGAVFVGNAENWQNKIETGGKGLSYGIEFFLQKKQGRTTGWISYTYAKSERQFTNINQGQTFPFKYDRKHDFSIVINHKISDKISFSADWIFGSGYPFTMPIARYNIINEGINNSLPNNVRESFGFFYNQNIYIYADRNTHRMRSYHRLDIALNHTKKVKKGIRTWTISVYNLYNRQNPFFYYTKYNYEENKIHLFQQSLFPIIPSVSYSFKFK